MPSVERPGIRSIRTDSALSARARSSWRLTIWLTFTPGAGWNSKTVMTGPGLAPSIVPSTPNSAQRVRMISPSRTSSSSSISPRSAAVSSSESGGSGVSGRSSTKPNSFCGSAGFADRLADAAETTFRTRAGGEPARSPPRIGRSRRAGDSAPGGGGSAPGGATSRSRRRCFSSRSSTTRCRCLTTTRRRARSLLLRSRRRSRARRRRSSQAARRRRQVAIKSPSVVWTRSARPTRKRPPRTTSAPTRFMRVASVAPTITPQAPPESIALPRQGRLGRRSWESAGSVSRTRPMPKPRPTTFGRAFTRNRRQAATARTTGTTRQVQPRRPNPAAAISAPKAPIQLRIASDPLPWCRKLGSSGWKLAKLAPPRRARAASRRPRISLPLAGDISTRSRSRLLSLTGLFRGSLWLLRT